MNTGPLASAAWLVGRDLFPKEPRWFVEVSLDAGEAPASSVFDERTASRFHIEIYSEEWGFQFCQAGRMSWIRVTDVPFVHGRDEHDLLREVPPLKDIGALIRTLEQRHAITLSREHALIRTSIQDAEETISRWVRSL
jgi:hypothetical protein